MNPTPSPQASTATDVASSLARRRETAIAVFAIVAIAVHLLLRFGGTWHAAWSPAAAYANWPLFAAYVFGGAPLVFELLMKLFRREFGSDLLAGISIVTALLLQEYLAGTLVILMLSGGEALENYAVRSASSVLHALAKRLPSVAHRQAGARFDDIPLDQVAIGDVLLVLPHETCPVDGTVLAGHSVMDESYLTGEPYLMSKAPGAAVLSGAVNGESALTIRADRLAIDSRYAKIMQVMRQSQQQRPRLRRLGDQLGAIYTPVAVAIGVAAWLASGEAVRFLAVMVVATPCPLLIAIPVAIIGSISLAAKRGIIVKDPVALERVGSCRTAIFDKTGTLTYGKPALVDQHTAGDWSAEEVLALAAAAERYSKHPLATAIVEAARQRQTVTREVSEISERPGEGLRATVAGHGVWLTSRQALSRVLPAEAGYLPPQSGGLECVIAIDDRYAATLKFRDAPRREGASFVDHLGPKHGFERVMLVSGDRESEVKYLAEQVGIREVFASQSPEEKLALVRRETQRSPVVFVGDGINDAPSLMAATVGIAFGQNSDVTTEAAGVVIMDTSLRRVDEFMHISQRMRRIALESAVGGMALSLVAMFVAAAGHLPPVGGAVVQEVIDVFAVLNALRVAFKPRSLVDFHE